MSDLERGSRSTYTSETLAAVEAVLGWEPGSVQRVLDGASPARETDDELAALLAVWPHLDDRARHALRVLADLLRS